MKKNEFFEKLVELLELDDDVTLSETTDLKDFEEFDSLAIMSIVAFADRNFSRKLSGAQLSEVDTVGSLMDVIGRENFD
ncbi:MAG: acyl carrier protein [Lentisphaeria bacterium]|nr:acyl carrier protein [Lentisphaeria bacterium]